MDSPFSLDYAEAREKFRAGATAAGAEIQTFPLEHRGPNDLDLTTDTAWVGPRDARAVLVTVSGTHGVEGFFGSAVQVEWLRRSKGAALISDRRRSTHPCHQSLRLFLAEADERGQCRHQSQLDGLRRSVAGQSGL